MHTRPNRTRSGSTLCGLMPEWLQFLRKYGSLILAALCLVAAYSVPPVVSYVLTIAAFVLAIEGGLSLYERANKAGGMQDFHQ